MANRIELGHIQNTTQTTQLEELADLKKRAKAYEKKNPI